MTPEREAELRRRHDDGAGLRSGMACETCEVFAALDAARAERAALLDVAEAARRLMNAAWAVEVGALEAGIFAEHGSGPAGLERLDRARQALDTLDGLASDTRAALARLDGER